MPYSAEHKDKTRQQIVRAAAKLFNRKGFADCTIAEVMKAAKLTHGGFYRHFNSKEELYAETVRHFLRKEARAQWQKAQPGSNMPDQPFARRVVDAYLSRDHLEDIEASCPLIGLATDVSRSGDLVKAAYRDVLEAMVFTFQSNMKGRKAREQALVFAAICVGGMVLARAVDDRDLGDDLRQAANRHILNMSGWVG